MTIQLRPASCQFRNPIGLAAARRQCTSGFGRWGDEIWDVITAEGCDGNVFKLATIIDAVARETGLSRGSSQSYTRAFIAYALACPDQFSGPVSRLTRDGHGWYYLADAGD